jgi:hypothetical protein
MTVYLGPAGPAWASILGWVVLPRLPVAMHL